MRRMLNRGSRAAGLAVMGLLAAPGWSASAPQSLPDPISAALAAIRTLQYPQAIALLEKSAAAGSAEAQYLLGSMYLNAVGVAADPQKARALLTAAAEGGEGAAAYVLAAELSNSEPPEGEAAHHWLERSAALGYARAADALRSGHLPLAPQTRGATEAALFDAWVMSLVCSNDANAVHRLGTRAGRAVDDFGRGALAHASECGALAAAKTLLELGAKVDASDHFGTTALMLAAQRPDTSMLELLLQHRADPNAADHEQRTALFYAARANNASAILLLQHAGARIDALDSHAYSALDVAMTSDSGNAATALRMLGAQTRLTLAAPGPLTGKFDASHPGEIYRGWQRLELAAVRDDAASVQQLLAASGPQPVPGGDTLLQAAIDAHATHVLALLLAHGASARAPDHSGHCPLWEAVVRHDGQILQALLADGVSPASHCEDEDAPLIAAARAGQLDSVQTLLTAGADVDTPDRQGETPLMIAAAASDVELLQALLGRHARIDFEDRQGRNALWQAAWSGTLPTVDALLRAGADPNQADGSGLTPLHA